MSMPLGYKHAAETKAKISTSLIGNKHFEGHKHSPETRKKISAAMVGLKRSLETRKKMAESKRGEGNGSWKGGKSIIGGYIYLKRPDHPLAHKRGYIAEHRLTVEKRLGRFLLPTEIPHHINGEKADNRDENLSLFSNPGEHTKYHKTKEKQL